MDVLANNLAVAKAQPLLLKKLFHIADAAILNVVEEQQSLNQVVDVVSVVDVVEAVVVAVVAVAAVAAVATVAAVDMEAVDADQTIVHQPVGVEILE